MLNAMQLSDMEQTLVKHVAAGTIFDLAHGAADDAIDAAVMGSWDAQHGIRAEVIRDILRGRHLPDGGADPHGLQLRGARIIGRLDLAHLISPIRLSLKSCHLPDGVGGEGCQIPDLDLSRSVVDVTDQYASDGAVRLLGAQISGQLSLRGAILTSETGPALYADGVSVGGDMFLDGKFTATGHGERGAVRLVGAQISGQLNLRGAILTNETGPALHADRVRVGSGMFLDGKFTATGHGERGAVRLLGAQITGGLWVDDETVGRAIDGTGWGIDGLTYDWHPTVGHPTVSFRRWLDFLRYGTLDYAAQPYQQLAAVARAAGHDADARRALMAQRDHQVKRGMLTRRAKAWARFTKLTLGYGYQPWRALIGVAGIVLIAILVTFFVPGALAVVTTSTTHELISTPCTSIQTFQIAVDMTIPLVSTGAGSACRLTSTVGGQAVGWIGVFLTLAGWALTALFAAGFTRAIRQP